MGITYRIVPEKSLTIVLWRGDVTQDELVAHFQKLNADPNWPAARGLQLSDMRQATASSMTLETLAQAVEKSGIAADKLARLKVAILAREEFRKSLAFARMMAKYRTSIIVFNSLDTACHWLGVDAEETERVLEEMRAGQE